MRDLRAFAASMSRQPFEPALLESVPEPEREPVCMVCGETAGAHPVAWQALGADRLSRLTELLPWMTPGERRAYRCLTGCGTPEDRRLAGPGMEMCVRAVTRPYRRGVSRLIPYLMERDHGRCQLLTCLFADRRVRAKSGPGGPSADHIVPWSLWTPSDGADPDCLENLQLAHLRCNLSKHNRYAGQMLLIG